MANTFVRQDGPGTFLPDKRRVSTQDINNMRKHINESIDERIHELVGQKHAVIRGGVVTINGGDDTKFDLEETMVSIHGQRVKVPAQAAITPGGVAATRFVILRYNLNESRQVTIAATPFDLDVEDGFALEGRDADAGAGEIRLATLTMSGSTISTVVSNLDNLRVDIPANSRILTVNTGEIKSVLNVESADLRYEPLITKIISADPGIINGMFQHWQANTLVASAPSLTYIADLFQYVKVGPQAHTLSRTIDVPTVADGAVEGSIFSPLIQVTTVNTVLADAELTTFDYRMEGLRFAPYFGQTFTITFLVKSDLVGTYAVAFRNAGGSRSFVATYIINSAATWEPKTITVTHDKTGVWNLDDSLGMIMSFTLASGANFQTTAGSWKNGNFLGTAGTVNFDATLNNKFRLGQYSMNLGTTAINNLKDTADDLNRIGRYFQVFDNLRMGFPKTGISQTIVHAVPFGIPMRAIPGISFSNITPFGGIGSPSAVSTNKNQTSISLTSTTAPNENVNSTFTIEASARF